MDQHVRMALAGIVVPLKDRRPVKFFLQLELSETPVQEALA